MFYIGIATFIAVLLVGLFDGNWPEFLTPLNAVDDAIYGVAGNFALVIEGALFISPGLLLARLGEALKRKADNYD
ncbi:MAG: hypothetical protein ABI667_07780 [Sphingomicrobium sp.]